MDDAVEAILATGRLPREPRVRGREPGAGCPAGLGGHSHSKNTRPGERAYLSHSPADGGNHPPKSTCLSSVVTGWQTGPFCPPGYVRQSEDRLCGPALCVELLTIRPCGEKDGKGIVKSSLFPRGLRSWRTQSAGPAIMPPTPVLTAVRAPRTSWLRPSTPSPADGERSFPGGGRPGPLLPPPTAALPVTP